ncbi:MAG: GspH/FimT family pseudopilin [Armatimonadota bacterium]|nr:GspH/FimT family pseudopilin [Armatimonadota bacterium]MDR7445066.1 GspH/FimT family pseudopilin [Armatimonadota bacterium]MDR7569851.1 GspH/FimT family pseudopilin [Armatimonadota bacterium]MDR7614152.1 GspH/FimT family pseudopilin [Armatimonadota bacterium]
MRDAPVQRESGQVGFTVIETLFVVVILAILLGLAFPAYQRVVMERRVQNTTREIAADIRVAQQAAVAKSAEAKCVGVAFEESRVGVYVVPQEASFDCTDPSASGLRAYGVLLSSQEYPTGVTVEHGPDDALAFVPSGTVYPTCTGDNCTAFRVTVRGGGHVRYVCVNAAGLVTVPPPGGSCP